MGEVKLEKENRDYNKNMVGVLVAGGCKCVGNLFLAIFSSI